MNRAENPYLSIVRPGALGSKFHYPVDAESLERDLKLDRRVFDDHLLEAIGWFYPPLFEGEMLELVGRELNPNTNRAGRPRTRRTSLADTAEHLDRLERDDLPPLFRAKLADRLRSRRRETSTKEQIKRHQKLELRRRNDLIAFLYRQIFQRLTAGKDAFYLKGLGMVDVSEEVGTPAERALTSVGKIMPQCLGYDVPATGRLRNIISENSRRST
ncbi:hypothetical protein [Erythrobacter sp.]|uniref:hypothetical protein n=1 Tax=Erythrobacter sp. TaxID=1042 RepID=UPI003C766F39